MKPRILIVEDEPAIADNIQHVLDSEGLDTLRCAAGLDVLPLLESERIDLILLDIGLPDVSGFDLLRELRKTHAIPVIFLTARTEEIDRVLGLEIGADDYVQKPFSPREVSARVKAVLRRTRPQQAPVEATPPRAFGVNGSKRQITFCGKLLELSKYEYEILFTLLGRPGHVFSRDELMRMVWDEPGMSLDRSVDAHIKNLRAKLRLIGPDLEPIVTHRGTGYSLRDDL